MLRIHPCGDVGMGWKGKDLDGAGGGGEGLLVVARILGKQMR